MGLFTWYNARMKVLRTPQGYFLCLETGEELVERLKTFISQHEIRAGAFTAIGAASEIDLGFYDLPNKSYRWKTFSGMFELASGVGNVSVLAIRNGEEPVIHMHAVFTDADYRAFGGHVRRMITGASCEISLVPHDTRLIRTFDETTGLNLFDI